MVVGHFFLQRAVRLPLRRMPEERRWPAFRRLAQPVYFITRDFGKLFDELFHRLVV